MELKSNDVSWTWGEGEISGAKWPNQIERISTLGTFMLSIKKEFRRVVRMTKNKMKSTFQSTLKRKVSKARSRGVWRVLRSKLEIGGKSGACVMIRAVCGEVKIADRDSSIETQALESEKRHECVGPVYEL